MWFETLPAFGIILAAVSLPAYGLWWCHYLTLGNALPSAAIIMIGLGLPGWGLYHIHNLTLGNHFRRSMLDRWERSQYQRDMRLTGNPYVVSGLEAIPDK